MTENVALSLSSRKLPAFSECFASQEQQGQNSTFSEKVHLHLSWEMWLPAPVDVPMLTLFELVYTYSRVFTAAWASSLSSVQSRLTPWVHTWVSSLSHRLCCCKHYFYVLAWAHVHELGSAPPSSNADVPIDYCYDPPFGGLQGGGSLLAPSHLLCIHVRADHASCVGMSPGDWALRMP